MARRLLSGCFHSLGGPGLEMGHGQGKTCTREGEEPAGTSPGTRAVSWKEGEMPEGPANFLDKVAPSLWRDCLMNVSNCGGDGRGDITATGEGALRSSFLRSSRKGIHHCWCQDGEGRRTEGPCSRDYKSHLIPMLEKSHGVAVRARLLHQDSPGFRSLLFR